MKQIGHGLRVRRLLGTSLALVLLGSLIPIAAVSAAASVTTLANASISADTTSAAGGSNTFTTLPGPAITEAAAGDVTPGGNVVLTLAGSWTFDTGGTAPAVVMTSPATGCTVTAITPAVVTTSSVTTTLAGSATATTDRCRLTFSGIRVKPTVGTLPNPGTITISYTGSAAIAGLASGATVGTLTMTAGAAAQVSFTTQPGASATGGTAFAPQPKVRVQDQFGNDVPGALVTLSKTPGTPTSGGPGTLSCTLMSVATGSPAYTDAQFSGCKIDLAGTAYKLRATSGSAFADSTPVTVIAGAADHLVFTSYPAVNTPALLTPQPTVQVVDAGGNLITGATNSITLTTNQNPGTFACTTNPKAATAGVAAFTGCTQTATGTGYTLTATASGLTSALGSVFTVTSGPANKLAICWGAALICNTTPPSPIVGDTVFTTQPEIRVQDAAGNTVVTDNSTVVALAILAGTPTSGGPGTLTCTANSGTVTNGVFTLSGCKIDKSGVGYKLNAAATGLTAGQTAAFNVTVGTPTKLVFLVQPPVLATAQAPFPTNIQVAIADAGGNTVTTGITATIILAIANNPSAGTLTCSGGNTATTTNGVATFTNCMINNQGNGYTLSATTVATAPVTVLTAATSNTFNVLAPNASIALSGPSVITWGEDMTLVVHFGVNGGNKAFTIQVTKDGVTWSNIAGASLTTNASGDASFVYGPSDNRYYRVSFAGTPDLQAATSNVVRTVVRQISLLRPTHNGYESIVHGTQITFKATVRPNRPELPQPVINFVIYQFQTGGWTKVLDRMVNSDRNPASADYGKASLIVTFNSIGKFYIRSQAVPTPLNANSGWSPPVRYTVN